VRKVLTSQMIVYFLAKAQKEKTIIIDDSPHDLKTSQRFSRRAENAIENRQ
jgi:hypothetical protein